MSSPSSVFGSPARGQFATLSLRNVLLADAVTCVVTGLTMSLLAAPLAQLLSIPAQLLFYAGIALLPIASLMAFVGTRSVQSAPWVWLIIAGNIAWALASAGLLVVGLVAPNALGVAFILFQASAVAMLTALEIKALAK